MKWIDERDRGELLEARPNLREKLEKMAGEGVDVDLWELESTNAGKKPLLLLARFGYTVTARKDFFLLVCQPGKAGGVYVYPFNPAAVPGITPVGYVMIDKDKLGRPRRVLTDKEKAYITHRREGGASINNIAKTMGISNRVIMDFCRSLEKEREAKGAD